MVNDIVKDRIQLNGDCQTMTGIPILAHLGRDLLVCYKAFWTEVAQPTMGSFHIVFLSPIFNDDPGFS
jgi:hypothetical protein